MALWLGAFAASLVALELAGPRLAAFWRARTGGPRGRAAWKLAVRSRTRVGVAFVGVCLALACYGHVPPFAPGVPNAWLAPALALMALGIVLRMAALGVIDKRKALATRGIYSACRHPLYFGTILMTLGVCMLFRQPWNLPAAWAYFFLLYPLTMAKEELENEQRFGAGFVAWRARTPLIVPLGRWRPVEAFDWPRSLLKGGLVALASMAGALVAAELMSDWMAVAVGAVAAVPP
jgi:protein-S-isoprenylcysteine O-methyltransferase Ste14